MLSTRRIAIIGVLVATTTVHAQEPEPTPAPAPAGAEGPGKGTLGFSFPVTLVTNVAAGLTDVARRVPTVDIVYFLSDKAAVDLIAGINIHRQEVDVGGGVIESNTLFGFAIGAGYRMYRSKNNLRSFIEPQVVLEWRDTAASETFGLNLAAVMGLERDITPWFSFSGAIGGALNFTDSFDDIQLATTANLAANLYWR